MDCKKRKILEGRQDNKITPLVIKCGKHGQSELLELLKSTTTTTKIFVFFVYHMDL
jgi:hypothetical protein